MARFCLPFWIHFDSQHESCVIDKYFLLDIFVQYFFWKFLWKPLMTTGIYINYSVFPWETAVKSKGWLLNFIATSRQVCQYSAWFAVLTFRSCFVFTAFLVITLAFEMTHIPCPGISLSSTFEIFVTSTKDYAISGLFHSISIISWAAKSNNWHIKRTIFEDIICDYDCCPPNTVKSCLFSWTCKIAVLWSVIHCLLFLTSTVFSGGLTQHSVHLSIFLTYFLVSKQIHQNMEVVLKMTQFLLKPLILPTDFSE